LRDITPHPIKGDKTRLIVIETRLRAEKAISMVLGRKQTFKDVIPPCWQEDGIDFFKVI
jgi:hypothetical protein